MSNDDPRSPKTSHQRDTLRLTDTDFEAWQNARDISGIPLDQLPTGPAKTALIMLVLEGKHIDAYTHADGNWVIEDRHTNLTGDARLTPAEWAERNGYPLTSEPTEEAPK